MTLMLSCISTRASLLRARWQRELDQAPMSVEHSPDLGGQICLLDELTGAIVRSVAVAMPAGLVSLGTEVAACSPYAIHRVAQDLSWIEWDAISLPSFNELHSVSRTNDGLLVASTGVDALVEVTADGGLLWSWWATAHGLDATPLGQRRSLDTRCDFRGREFGTLQQTTHVNSAVELPDGRILASLFHQGMIVAIDRHTGAWRPVLDGLSHPHALQRLADGRLVLADSQRGIALLARWEADALRVIRQIRFKTSWLQHCSYDSERDRWVLVDGGESRLVLLGGEAGTRFIGEIALDPEWRVYEALALAD